MNPNDDARIGLFEKVITEGATDENGNLLDICEMIKRKKEESVGGQVIHFTDLESLVNIVTGRQLRLTRFDEMFWAGDEGKIIFQYLEDAVQTIDEKVISSEKIQKLKALVENKKTKEGTPIINHFFSDTGTYEEAIPYVICFTTNITGTLSQWLRDQEIGIIFQSDHLELDICDNMGRISCQGCFSAAELVPIRYDEEIITERLKEIIIHYLKNEPNGDLEIRMAASRIEGLRLACLKSSDANEWEKRLIFYLPVKAENHPQIMEHVHNERKLNSDGELIESLTNDDIHIYLNFNDEKKEFCAYYNDDEISLEKCQNELGDRGSEVHLFRRQLQ